MKTSVLIILCLFVLTLSACAVPTAAVPTALPTLLAENTVTPVPTEMPLPKPSAQPTATPEEPMQVCAPLSGWALEDVTTNITNPYQPPALGSDDPHQAIDLTVFDASRQISLKGAEVQSVLPGRVAGVINGRFPYGNAVIVEAHLDEVPESWLSGITLPIEAPITELTSALTCPDVMTPPEWDVDQLSVYVLYAHLQQPVGLQVGDEIGCGQALGAVGMTGNALNPHLHVEMRAGPADFIFSGMAHYDVSANAEEMANYCLWRVSGLFWRFDPLLILQHMQD